jgi:hypothetical protein
MPIFMTKLFICEVCGKLSSETEETWLYSDTPVNPPDNEKWGFNDDDELCCPDCLPKYV